MSGTAESGHKIVRCTCNDVRVAGTYEVEEDGRFLVLTTPFGVDRVPLGIMEPRRVAKKLMRNICTKATAAPTRACRDAAASAYRQIRNVD